MLQIIMSRFGIEKYLSSRYFSSWLILTIDTVVSVVSTLIAYLLVRGLFTNPVFTVWYGFWLLAGSCVLSVFSFIVFRTFRSVIRHTTLREIWKLGGAVLFKDLLMFFYVLLLPQKPYPPYASLSMGFLLDALVTLFLLLALRLCMIVVYDLIKLKQSRRANSRQVLVYGTGDKSVSLVTRLQNSPHYRVVGFLTYGKSLRKHTIAECPVYYFENQHSVEYLRDRVDVDAILFATNDDAQQEQERLIRYCTEQGVKILIAPPIDEVIDGKIMKQSIREIKIEDLLGRPEIRISMDEIIANFRGRTILVTGAAGSIGSELCRQLATFGVKELILFDNGETPMHNLRLELEERYPALKFIPVIGDVRIPARLDFVFRTYHPQVVFHAAAYKHVPLMEENPCEAVLVNVAGTRNVADKCIEYDVEKMVMISTDKAVNPTNVMGCSKRICEIYVQSLARKLRQEGARSTQFITTRFGNVLGSNGSVIPRFRDQIQRGGPVTVTHPEIIRYFMTIPEACRLVLEAGSMGNGGEIYIFDMGNPVKIVDLAKRMISLSGRTDVKIEFTGLRHGEKLYEELLNVKELTKPTYHDKIMIATVREYDYDEVKERIQKLIDVSYTYDQMKIVAAMKDIVPEFVSKNSCFEILDKK